MKQQADIRTFLAEALSDCPTLVPPAALEQLAAHWDLVANWNQRSNLTRITDPSVAARAHYRDSLELLGLLRPGSLVDLGSGAGFPGIPIAIVDPEREVWLVESRRKKASFLETVVARLALARARVLEGRMEDPPPRLFATAVTRATFSSLESLFECKRWVAPGGVLVCFRADDTDIGATTVHSYRVGGETRALHCFTVE